MRTEVRTDRTSALNRLVSCCDAFREGQTPKPDRLNSRVELVANVLTISTCLLVASLVVVRLYRPSPPAPQELLNAGKTLKSTEEVRFETARLTVLVGLQSSCKFCGESMPALRQLEKYVSARTDRSVSVVALGTEPVGGLTQYLEFNQLKAFRPVSVRLDSSLAPVALRTPTIALVNELGEVLAARAGVVSVERMEEVISLIEETLREREVGKKTTGSGGGQ